MLSLFPSLLVFEGFTPLLLRLTLGAVFAFWAYGKLKDTSFTNIKKSMGSKEKIEGFYQAVISLSLIVGFLTQLSALLSLLFFGYKLFQKIQNKAFVTYGINYYLILFVISLAILISGAGFLAFDLPL